MKAPDPLKEWTIMLYLAGDNNLSDEMVWTLTELFRVTLPAQIAVTVQFDPVAKGGRTRFYPTQCPVNIDGAFRLEGKRQREVNSASPEVLAKFIKRSVEENAAKNYALILSGHGSGIEGDFLTDDNIPSNKGSQKGSLKISELGHVFTKVKSLCAKALHANGKDKAKKAALEVFLNGPDGGGRNKLIDLLGMDSCLMSMAEVASEVKDNVKYLVGSEGFVQATGWPYYRLFQHLKEHIQDAKAEYLDAKYLATSIVHRCTNYYADYHDANVSFDMAACALDEIAGVERAVKEFADFTKDHLLAKDQRVVNLILLAHWKAQSYKWEAYTDIWDFFSELYNACEAFKSKDTVVATMADLSNGVMWAIKERAVVCSRFTGSEFQYSRGLSIYFPWSEYDYSEHYEKTMFAKETGWGTFLRQHFAATKREERSDGHEDQNGWKRFDFPSVGTQSSPETAGQAHQEVRGATKTTPPHGRTTPPHGRTVDLIDAVGETLSRMKNLPTASKDYLILPQRELSELNELEKRLGLTNRKVTGVGR